MGLKSPLGDKLPLGIHLIKIFYQIIKYVSCEFD